MLKLKIKGFTLIEILTVLTITSILTATLISMYEASTLSYKRSISTNRLSRSLQSAMLLMTSDIRRAGFWKNARTDIGSGSNSNPFMAVGITINSADNCILFSYDKLGLGSLPDIGVGSDDERYGFRLVNGAIKSRPSGAAFSCTASDDSWVDITDPDIITITALTFTKASKTINITSATGTPTLTMNTVQVSITGQLVSDSSISKTISQLVLVRNNNYAP